MPKSHISTRYKSQFPSVNTVKFSPRSSCDSLHSSYLDTPIKNVNLAMWCGQSSFVFAARLQLYVVIILSCTASSSTNKLSIDVALLSLGAIVSGELHRVDVGPYMPVDED